MYEIAKRLREDSKQVYYPIIMVCRLNLILLVIELRYIGAGKEDMTEV